MAESQLIAAKAALTQQSLKNQGEIELKRAEDVLTGVYRDLSSLRVRQLEELQSAQAAFDKIKTRLEALNRELSSTHVSSPVNGRIISIRFYSSGATIQILVSPIL